MTAHTDGHPEGRGLCEGLLAELNQLLGPTRHEAKKKSCSFWQPDLNRFAYLYHHNRSPSVCVYFRTDADFAFSVPQSAFEVQTRPSIREKGWTHDFSCYFDIEGQWQIQPAAQFLSAYAAPLAVPKKQQKQLASAPHVAELLEGRASITTHTTYERNRDARTICIEWYGRRCHACHIDLGEVYGQIAQGFIHVHHEIPLSKQPGPRRVDPIRDLYPVCPNCHAIIHLHQPPLSLDEVRELLAENAT